MDDLVVTEYRRVSVLAVLALLLGLAASGALIGGVLFALPVLGLGVGLLAIAKIESGDGSVSGLRLAQWGIFFSVLFGAAAVVHPLLFQEIVDEQSRSFGRNWLEILTAGDTEQALKRVNTRAKGQLVPKDARGKPTPTESIEVAILEAFQKTEIVQKLREAGKRARIRYERTVSVSRPAERQTWVTQIFSVTRDDSASSDSEGKNRSERPSLFHVQLHLQKNLATKNLSSAWTVGNWELVDEKPKG